MPMFSIIVPVYKAERYLNRCVDSILQQSNDNFELILVNDGSPDKCPQICDEYAVLDKRVIVIHKENGGVSSARNLGINVANGKYLVFVDSDDFIDTDMISIYEKAINNNQSVDYLISGTTMITYDNETIEETIDYKLKTGVYNTKTLLEALNIDYPLICISGPCSKVFKKEILDKHNIRFNEELTLGEDGYFNICYIEHCQEIVTLNDICYYYIRQNTESLYSVYHKDCLEVHEIVYDKMREVIVKNNCDEICKMNFEKMYYDMLISCIIKDFQNPNKTNKVSRKETIVKVVGNKHITENINFFMLKGIKNKIISVLITLGRVKLLYLIFRIYYQSYFRGKRYEN